MTPITPPRSEWMRILEGIEAALANALREADRRASATSAAPVVSLESLEEPLSERTLEIDRRAATACRPLGNLDCELAGEEQAARERVTALTTLRSRLAEATGRAIG